MLRSAILALLVSAFCACERSSSGLPDGFLTADPRGFSSGGSSAAPPPGGEASGAASALAQAIEEANLYRIDGDRLYLLNAWNGLMVVDLTQPALLGALDLPGLPVEMYLHGDRALVLSSTEMGDTLVAEVVVTDPAQPSLASSHELAGAFHASRKIGDRLLALAGEQVHSFAVEPALVPQASLAIPGGAQFAHATDGWLFVAAPEGEQDTRVTLVDVSDPTGALELAGSLPLSGYVADEHKLHFGGGHLRVVTHDGSDEGLSRLFSIDVSDPASPQVVGALELAYGEQLFATRFSEDQAYLVTFEQVDPLWIIDLSDPAQPRVTGSLVVPGWSTHLVVLPGRLVALGVDPAEGWHATVSVFDVSDPAAPALADRVDFGWGWSSAFEDVRGFGVFEDEGWVLVPFASETNRLAALTLQDDDLDLSGWIEVEGPVLRGFPHGEALWALGAEELVRADPASLASTAEVTLARNVADVARLANGTLIEAVARSTGCRIGGVDLPLQFSALYVHGDRAAVTGWDDEGPAAYVVDFAAASPSISERLPLGSSASWVPPSGAWGAPGSAGAAWGPSAGALTPSGRLVLPGLPAVDLDVTLGQGELQDGFTVIDLASASIESALGLQGAYVSGFAIEGEELALTAARYVGDDPEGRPLLLHDLSRVDLELLKVSEPINVPGFVVRSDGVRLYTLEETWGPDWSFEVAALVSDLSSGAAAVLESFALPSGAYDFRPAGERLWFTSYASVTVGSTGVASGGAGGAPSGPTGEIASVELVDPLALGPALEFEESFGSLLLAEESAALVIRDGWKLERWDVAGPTAALSWAVAVGSWPQSARADTTVGAYWLALGYGGSVVVP
jgi:hypothetical protein